MSAASSIEKFIKGSAISFVATALIGLLNYLTRRTLALNLTEEQYGYFYSCFSFVSLFLVFLDLGINQSGTILISKYHTRCKQKNINATFSVLLAFKLAVGIFLCIALIFSTNSLITHYFKFEAGKTAFVLLCLFIPCQALMGAVSACVEGYKDFWCRGVLWTLYYLIIFILVFTLVKTFSVTIAAFAYLVSSIAMFAFGGLYLNSRYKVNLLFSSRLAIRMLKETFLLSRWIAISVAGLTAMFYLDTLMLTFFKGLTSVALYNIALPVMQIIQTLAVFPIVFTPIATEMWNNGHLDKFSSTCSSITILLFSFMWFTGMTVPLMSKYLITILFSSKYLAASTPLIILCVGMTFLILAQFNMNALSAMEKPKKVALTIILGVALNIIANLVLIPYFDVNGAAFATAISYFSIFIVSFSLLKKEINMQFDRKRLFIMHGSGLILCLIAMTLYTQNPSLVQALIYALILSTCFAGICFACLFPYFSALYQALIMRKKRQ